LFEKGVALTARDQAVSRLEQAIEEKKWAISLQDSAIDERRDAVERIEE
jgi:tartrate dehydratase beta subunit/fumarate hydratase class I family protein